jgi:aminoglycoside phosphotransferase (APT) family kinase protein
VSAISGSAGATPALDGVHRALHEDLEAGGDDDATRRHVLGVADVLLHRAVQDDLRGSRRDERRDELAALVSQMTGDDVPADDDPFRLVEVAAERVAAGSVKGDLVEQVLRLIVAADLPELGRNASTDREAAEVAAMDLLGREEAPRVTVQDVADYLAAKYPVEPINVTSLTQLSGGFSKTTLLVGIHRAGQAREEIVIRQVPPGRDVHTLVGEFNVVRFAWKHGVLAPEPLWLEPHDNTLGGPFFTSRRVAGTNLGDVFGPRPGTGPEAGIGLAQALAKLHQVPVDDVPETPVTPMVTRGQILEAVSHQEDLATTAAAVDGPEPHPLHALLFAWLSMHAPEVDAKPVLLHGDPGFHNMLVNGGEVQALLDWERARLGDAAQDLAYVRPHVTLVQPWQDFLDAYCEAGGESPDEDRLRYYSVWHDAWRFTGAYRGRGRLLSQPSGLLAGVTGLLHAPRFLLNGLRIAYEVDL